MIQFRPVNSVNLKSISFKCKWDGEIHPETFKIDEQFNQTLTSLKGAYEHFSNMIGLQESYKEDMGAPRDTCLYNNQMRELLERIQTDFNAYEEKQNQLN